jgi:hypothetical protein
LKACEKNTRDALQTRKQYNIMPVVSPDRLIALQQAADGVRNICILAHVVRLTGSIADDIFHTDPL